MKKYLIIVAIISASCKKEETVLKEPIPLVSCSTATTDIETCKKLIIGSWNWSYEKVYYRAYPYLVIKTPTTESYTRQMEFKNNSIASIYSNSIFQKQVKYSVTTLDKVSNYATDSLITTLIFYDLQTGLRVDFAPISGCTDSLTLYYNFYSETKGLEKWNRN